MLILVCRFEQNTSTSTQIEKKTFLTDFLFVLSKKERSQVETMEYEWDNQANFEHVELEEGDSVAKYIDIVQRALAKAIMVRDSLAEVKEILEESESVMEAIEVNSNSPEPKSPILETPKSNREKYICGICESVFENMKTYRKHILLHTSHKKAFCCNLCDKGFVQSSHLLKHVRNEHKGQNNETQ